jgi:tetratricopeptide (TPR) repeat protein
MAELLDENIQEKIDELTEMAYTSFQDGNYDKCFDLYKKAWNLYPDPKENWVEAYNTAKYIFEDYLKIKKLDEAKKWLEKMTVINNSFRSFDEGLASDEEVDFCEGKYNYEIGNYDEAYKLWREVVKKSGKNHFRFFENQDKKYFDFYKKQRDLNKEKK